MKKDYQRNRVYAWQAEWVGGDPKGGEHIRPLKLRECERLACEVANDNRIKAKRFNNASEYAFALPEFKEVYLPKWARKPWIICHEAAHVACGTEEGHGPTFVKTYIEILADMLGFDEGYLRRTAEWWGVKVAP